MTFAGGLSFYIGLNIAVIVLFAGTVLAMRFRVPAGFVSRLNRGGMVLFFAVTAASPLLPYAKFFEPPVKIWAAKSGVAFREAPASEPQSVLSLSSTPGAAHVSTMALASGFWSLAAALTVVFLLIVGRDLLRLRALLRRSFLIRRRGRVRIFASDSLRVPLSFWFPGLRAVVVPTGLLAHARDLRIAIQHELQHHRQGDTRWVYVLRTLRLFCAANPFASAWGRRLDEIQEFACDADLIGRRKVSSRDYTGCLLRVAENAIASEDRFVCATGLAFGGGSKILKRRIQMILETKSQRRTSVGLALAALLSLVVAGTAWASQSLIRDRQVTWEQARGLAEKTSLDFPVTVNAQVLAALNEYVGTPSGRAFMRDALARMEGYRSMVASKIAQYGVPTELMAIPLVESGYQNLPPKSIERSAGLWQMIQSTAWLYTLNVWPPVDDRMDPEKLTDAALRMLLSDKIRFGDWELSILSYNAGEKVVSKGILKTRSRDAWTLIRNGYEGDKGYLARVMAAVLIMKNPSLLEN